MSEIVINNYGIADSYTKLVCETVSSRKEFIYKTNEK
jgi:hypothetical protein